MTRRALTDAHWAIIEPFCLGKSSDPGQTGRDPHLFVEAVLWIVRTGAQWNPVNTSSTRVFRHAPRFLRTGAGWLGNRVGSR
ncbi:transposase [Szabonella alba]|uniref:Transposase n=1 Tax=Szabonella alba TaxID=2804194 RepID=A0A8K0VG67_9RHOB|nr:transposase [Szabonella alba]